MKFRSLFRKNLENTAVSSGITGEISMHDEKLNRQAISRMLVGDNYTLFGIRVVLQAIRKGHLDHDRASSIMAASLGIDERRFRQKGSSFIQPEITLERLVQMFTEIDLAIAAGETIALGTGHPGSMLQFYLLLEEYILRAGGQVAVLTQPLRFVPGLRLDTVDAVMVVSDRGSLHHTHDFKPWEAWLSKLGTKNYPGLAIADHGFAGAAINAGIKTIGLHDVDDPGIPIAAVFGANVIPVPMNDNQLNIATAQIIRAIIQRRLEHEGTPPTN